VKWDEVKLMASGAEPDPAKTEPGPPTTCSSRRISTAADSETLESFATCVRTWTTPWHAFRPLWFGYASCPTLGGVGTGVTRRAPLRKQITAAVSPLWLQRW